jgi:hypothetical protein
MATANPRGSLLDGPSLPVDDFESGTDTGPAFPSTESPPGSIPSGTRYIGAGIIQRMPNGGYALTSPTGQKLAEIEGNESVLLEEFVGKQVGLHGKRWYREDIRSDYIEVSGLEPVRIRQ